MSVVSDTKSHTSTPSRYVLDEDFSDSPGREADVGQIVFAQFGVQGPKADSGEQFIKDLRRLFSLEHGPRRIERCHHWDAAGCHEDILMAYWMETDEYGKWLELPDVSSWWSNLPLTGELGYWREVLSPDTDRFGFLGFGLNEKRRVGCIHAVRSKATEKFGYWGGYRDRFTASKVDKFEPEFALSKLPPQLGETRGRRVQRSATEKHMFRPRRRETTHVSPQEREGWEKRVKPVFDKWIAYLRDNPSLSGAVCLRDTMEQNIDTGADYEKHNTLIYFVSLRHMERAARTQPSHVALYNSYMGMMTDLGAASVIPEMMIWAEAHIVSRESVEAEYVNCHNRTGLMPYFMT